MFSDFVFNTDKTSLTNPGGFEFALVISSSDASGRLKLMDAPAVSG